MSTAVAQREEAIEWSVASRAIRGQAVSGDLHLVTTWDGGALIAVVDGLGHGEEATFAARQAVRALLRDTRRIVSLVSDTRKRPAGRRPGIHVTA